jgi:tellurite resistance protein TehA-like permease
MDTPLLYTTLFTTTFFESISSANGVQSQSELQMSLLSEEPFVEGFFSYIVVLAMIPYYVASKHIMPC